MRFSHQAFHDTEWQHAQLAVAMEYTPGKCFAWSEALPDLIQKITDRFRVTAHDVVNPYDPTLLPVVVHVRLRFLYVVDAPRKRDRTDPAVLANHAHSSVPPVPTHKLDQLFPLRHTEAWRPPFEEGAHAENARGRGCHESGGGSMKLDRPATRSFIRRFCETTWIDAFRYRPYPRIENVR